MKRIAADSEESDAEVANKRRRQGTQRKTSTKAKAASGGEDGRVHELKKKIDTHPKRETSTTCKPWIIEE